VADEVVADAVGNVIALAGLIMPLAPYTAVTVAGVPDADGQGWVVKSRADMAGRVLLEHAKRNPRVLAFLARFNLMFRNVELVEVSAALVASVAVDARLVPPDATIALPGGAQMPILAPAIGDTIEYIASQREAAAAPEFTTIATQARRTQSSTGVAEPEAPWVASSPVDEVPSEGEPARDEPSPSQLRKARAARERLAARDAELAAGRPDPTLRREGQAIVPGGVTDT